MGRDRVFDPAGFKLRPIEEDRDFMSALRHKEFGNLGGRLRESDLFRLDELELSAYGITDLSGIHQCSNLSSLDLSSNDISDIKRMQDLCRLEGLDLSFNRIVDVTPLSELPLLRDVDLSYNGIESILPLMDLDGLAYLNITGNPTPVAQTERFRKKGVTVAR